MLRQSIYLFIYLSVYKIYLYIYKVHLYLYTTINEIKKYLQETNKREEHLCQQVGKQRVTLPTIHF